MRTENDIAFMKQEARTLAHSIAKSIDQKSSVVCLVAIINVLEFMFRSAPTKETRDVMKDELETFVEWLDEYEWGDKTDD